MVRQSNGVLTALCGKVRVEFDLSQKRIFRSTVTAVSTSVTLVLVMTHKLTAGLL